jgi:hypothetical protein|nr:MAG TPA: hypothetical protein [Caudoviricetes sp.]
MTDSTSHISDLCVTDLNDYRLLLYSMAVMAEERNSVRQEAVIL